MFSAPTFARKMSKYKMMNSRDDDDFNSPEFLTFSSNIQIERSGISMKDEILKEAPHFFHFHKQ